MDTGVELAMNRLAQILETKVQEVELAKSQISLEEIKRQCADLPPRNGFRAALDKSPHEVALIAEVKKASPSQGLIRSDFDAVEVAQIYEEAGADCLSVLTDVEYFQGSPENLRRVRKAVDLPLLRKDFTIDSYQIYEALLWGADAILLIVAALLDSRLTEFYDEAKSVGLDVLVEVHKAEELERSQFADLVGVNNRDLATFTTKLQTTQDLSKNIPDGAIFISESALSSHADVEFVQRAGARGVLIGTAFCKEGDIGAKVREVMGW